MTPRLKSASALIAACLLTATARGQPYVEDSIDVGGAWVGSMCYNSRADVIYGRCQTAGLFWAIACSTNQVVSSFYVPTPRIMVYDSLDNKAYCTFTTGEADSVLVVDGSTHRRLRAIELEWAATPVWDPVDNRVWVSCTEANEVACIDCRTDSIICHIAVGAGPLKMHLNTRRRKLYVQNYDEGSVSIIDLNANRVLRTLPTGDYPQSGCYSYYADKYYCDGGGRVTVIDGRGDSVIGRIVLPAQSSATAMVSEDSGSLLLVGIYGGHNNLIYVVDAQTDSVKSTLTGCDGPVAFVWSRPTNLVYCASDYSDAVLAISGDGSRVIATLSASDAPFALCLSPVQRRVYVGHLNSSRIYVIRDSAAAVREGVVSRIRQDSATRIRPSVFCGQARVECDSGEPNAALRVYAQDGRLVRSLPLQRRGNGRLRAVWDGRDSRGRDVPAGVYFVSETGGATTRTKIVKLK